MWEGVRNVLDGRRCFACAEWCEKACGYDGPCGAYATMPFRPVLPIGRGCLWGGGSVLYVASCNMVAHKTQCLSYMRLMNLPLGLVINFGDYRLGKRGIARLILAGADAEEADF